VNLIGEHVDYNGGLVLPMAIERYTVVSADYQSSDESHGIEASMVSAYSQPLDQSRRIVLGEPDSKPDWTSYVAGTLSECRDAGLPLDRSLDVVITSTVPLGGGLSSSAALEVAVATLMERIHGRSLELLEKALLCQRAEHRYAHVPCGIMDQAIVAAGLAQHLMLLDCRDLAFRMIRPPQPAPQVLIINSNVHHELADSQYAVRRQQCESACAVLGVTTLRELSLSTLTQSRDLLADVSFRRARHVVSEIERTVVAAEALEAGDWQAVGTAMNASHASLRDDYEVSCEELDLLVAMAQDIGPSGGVYGARMTGGGFGGCTVMLVDAASAADISQQLCARYLQATGRTPTAFVTQAAGGAAAWDA
jgi:galactokinase